MAKSSAFPTPLFQGLLGDCGIRVLSLDGIVSHRRDTGQGRAPIKWQGKFIPVAHFPFLIGRDAGGDEETEDDE